LKKDFSGYIGSLQKAIKSKDSETSHYAAAALMEIKKEYEVIIGSAGEEYSKSKKNHSGEIDLLPARNYAEILNKYLESGIADEIDYYDYLNKYSELLEFLIKEESENEKYFMAKITADIKLGDHERAFEYCKMFAGYYPENENSYLTFLKLFYVLKDHNSFNKVISVLRKKNIHISEDMMHKLEFWEVA
jgi:hypothetical protein